jgi:hypothetical protein
VDLQPTVFQCQPFEVSASSPNVLPSIHDGYAGPSLYLQSDADSLAPDNNNYDYQDQVIDNQYQAGGYPMQAADGSVPSSLSQALDHSQHGGTMDSHLYELLHPPIASDSPFQFGGFSAMPDQDIYGLSDQVFVPTAPYSPYPDTSNSGSVTDSPLEATSHFQTAGLIGNVQANAPNSSIDGPSVANGVPAPYDSFHRSPLDTASAFQYNPPPSAPLPGDLSSFALEAFEWLGEAPLAKQMPDEFSDM